MTKPRSELKNMSASVHARLLSFAKKERRDFNQVLTQFFQERLLDRLARSRHDEQFALKGVQPSGAGQPKTLARDRDRQSAWAGYLRKERIDTVPDSFETVMPVILGFVGPPFRAAGDGISFGLHWDPARREWR